MAITIQKELYMSIFPHIAIVKIDNIWRICRGHYTDNGGGYADLFVTPYMGQIIKATYPDFRIYDLGNNTEEQLYHEACAYNVSQLSQKKAVIATPAQPARATLAQTVAAEIEDQMRRRIIATEIAEIQRRLTEAEQRDRAAQRNNVYYTTTDGALDEWDGYGYGATYNT